jgi:protein O-mannosyl-transferase
MDWLNDITKKYPLWILISTGFILYSYSLFNGFVGDDFDQLVNNNFIHSIANIPYFFLGGTFNNGFVSLSGIYYKPVMTIVFSILYSLFQATPFFYHFTQLLFHIANVILLFYLFKKFFPRQYAFSASLIFLIHPINTEAVSYISNLQDVLFTFFGLSGLLLLMYKPQTMRNILIAYLLFLLALLSKETGIVFIALGLFYQFLYNHNQTKMRPNKAVILNLIQDPERFRNKFGMTESPVLLHCLFSILTISIYAVLRIRAVGLYNYQTEHFPMVQLSLPERLINIPQILFYYIKTISIPIHLAFAQNWVVTEISLTTFYLPLLVIGIVISLLTWFGLSLKKDHRSFRIFLFFLGFIVLGMSLHLQILPLDMTVADRWFYVPFIGVLGMLAIIFTHISKHKKSVPGLQYGFITLVLLLFCLTFTRSLNWQSQYSLYQHDVRYNTTSYNLLNGWASELMNVGKYNDAEPYIRKSIALKSDFCYSWNNLGSVYAVRKEYGKAREYYETALKRNPCVLAYNNLATLMNYHFEVEDAYIYTKSAIKEVPGSPRLWLMLALIEHKRGNDDKALKAANRSYQLSPSSAAAYVITSLQNKQPFELKEY